MASGQATVTAVRQTQLPTLVPPCGFGLITGLVTSHLADGEDDF